jgi:hypothetical protein
LGTGQTDIKAEDYFQWKERSLFDCTVQFGGSSQTTNKYGKDDVTTIITYQSKSSDVINNGRENKFPKIKTDGSYKIETSESFNPAGKFGKIQDSDLIRIKHNPCFDCSFTAWVNLRKRTENLIFTAVDDLTPPTGDESYEKFEITSGPDFISEDPEDEEPLIGFLVNAVQRVVTLFTIKIHSGIIDPKTKNLGNVLTFTGFTESKDNSSATLKVGSVAYKGYVLGIEEGIKTQINWLPNNKRPA